MGLLAGIRPPGFAMVLCEARRRQPEPVHRSSNSSKLITSAACTNLRLSAQHQTQHAGQLTLPPLSSRVGGVRPQLVTQAASDAARATALQLRGCHAAQRRRIAATVVAGLALESRPRGSNGGWLEAGEARGEAGRADRHKGGGAAAGRRGLATGQSACHMAQCHCTSQHTTLRFPGAGIAR